MDKFMKVGGESIGDLGNYLRKYVKENSKGHNLKIYVGCDSSVGKVFVHFVTAIVLYKEGKGGHIIYCKDKILRSKWMNSKPTDYTLLQGRLLNEVQYSLEVADYIEKELTGYFTKVNPEDKICDIDLDLNPEFGNGQNKSNLVFEHGKGWVIGSGYKVRCKPYAVAATSCADLLLKV